MPRRVQSRPLDGRWRMHACASDAARSRGVSKSSISACCSGISKTARGFEFAWVDPPEPQDIRGELWRPFVDGTSVSSFGRYRNKRGVAFSPMQGEFAIGGKMFRVARVIAVAFGLHRSHPSETEIWHRDGDICNNRLDNLFWAAPGKGACKPVEGRRRGEPAPWTAYDSATCAARALGLRGTKISACCRGERRHTGGFEFRFALEGTVTAEERDIIASELETMDDCAAFADLVRDMPPEALAQEGG